jgi:hypothetical protein
MVSVGLQRHPAQFDLHVADAPLLLKVPAQLPSEHSWLAPHILSVGVHAQPSQLSMQTALFSLLKPPPHPPVVHNCDSRHSESQFLESSGFQRLGARGSRNLRPHIWVVGKHLHPFHFAVQTGFLSIILPSHPPVLQSCGSE